MIHVVLKGPRPFAESRDGFYISIFQDINHKILLGQIKIVANDSPQTKERLNMSSPVELPADGNPLTETNLLHALTAASSTAPQQIKAGTSQLQAWETRDGYFGLLQVSLENRVP